jgi:hypothetical protein
MSPIPEVGHPIFRSTRGLVARHGILGGHVITDVEKQILLDFQRAHYAFSIFPEVAKVRTAYFEAKESLKKITAPVVAELARRMSQEWLYDETPDSRSINRERADDIMSAEKELYGMTWQYGDNTIPNATDTIQ